MFDTTRELIAYGLVAAIILIAIPWAIVVRKRRNREKLRRKGIKRYGH